MKHTTYTKGRTIVDKFSREWCVYRLIDKRDGKPFYIGMTFSPLRRLKQHLSSERPDVRARCDGIRAAGLRVEMQVVGAYKDKQLAVMHERYLLDNTKGLLNEPNTQKRRKVDTTILGVEVGPPVKR